MYTITIKHKDIGAKTYEIYTKEEADKEGLQYSHWKKAREGQWALSDDGFVSKVIKRKKYPTANQIDNIYLRFAWGYTFFNPEYEGKELKVKGRKSNTTMSGKRPIEVKAKQERMKNLAMVYAQIMDYNKTIEHVLDNPTSNQKIMWKRRMKKEKFTDMVREELQSLLKEHGLTEEYTLELLEATIDTAKAKGDVTNLMRAVDNLQDMHGMKEKNQSKTVEQIEATSNVKLIDELKEEEKSLTVQRTQIEEKKEKEKNGS